MADLSHLKGVIWDLDDTLYAVNDGLKRSMRESIARSVVDMGFPITFEDALKMAEESQKIHRLTVKLLVEKFGIGHEELHLPFHANMDHLVIPKNPALPVAFAEAPHLNHVLVTHASREWAVRMLDHLGITDFFPAHHVLGLEDIDFEKKDSSERATKTGLSLMGLNPGEVAFAEDRAYNLTIPHRLGLTTALIDHPSQPRELPAHVHHRFQDAAALLAATKTRHHIKAG